MSIFGSTVNAAYEWSPLTARQDWSGDESTQSLIRHLRDLPFANLGVAITLARGKLQSINNAELPALRRTELAHLFHFAFARFAEQGSRRGLIDVSTRLGEGSVSGFVGLCEELSRAYRLALEVMDADTPRQSRVDALHFALFFHAQALFHRMIYNMVLDDEDWTVAHQVYLHAEREAATDCGGKFQLAQALPTIHDQYVQLLLVAGASPYSLSQDDTRHVIDIARTGARECRVTGLGGITTLVSGLGVRLDRSHGPLRMRYTPRGEHPAARLVSTDGLCRALPSLLEHHARDWAERSRQEQRSEAFNPARLLRHLDDSWRCQRFRGRTREPAAQNREIVFGISGICRWLRNGRRLTTGNFSERVTTRAETQVYDISSTGMRFSVPGTLETLINAGDVFILPEDSFGPASIALGITRWACESHDGRIMLGAMRFNAWMEPVSLHDSQADHEIPAVLLRRTLEDREQSYLLTAANHVHHPLKVHAQSAIDGRPVSLLLHDPLLATDVVRLTAVEEMR
jgi:hypothetical protein